MKVTLIFTTILLASCTNITNDNYRDVCSYKFNDKHELVHVCYA